jgi:hypothetical protein
MRKNIVSQNQVFDKFSTVMLKMKFESFLNIDIVDFNLLLDRQTPNIESWFRQKKVSTKKTASCTNSNKNFWRPPERV